MQKRDYLQLFVDRGLLDVTEKAVVEQLQAETGQPPGRILIDHKILTEKRIHEFATRNIGFNPDQDYSERNYNLAGLSIARKRLSGDFFGFFPLDEGTMVLTLLDVNGQGPEAALIGVILSDIFKNYIKTRYIIPHSIVRKINHAGVRFLGPDQFASVNVLLLDMNRGMVEYCCAGSPPILIYRQRNKAIERLEVAGIPVGIYDDIKYTTGYTELSRDDILLMYSNGACDAQSFTGRFYGINGVEKCLMKYASHRAGRLLSTLKRELFIHTFMRGLNDDTTFVALKKTVRKNRKENVSEVARH